MSSRLDDIFDVADFEAADEPFVPPPNSTIAWYRQVLNEVSKPLGWYVGAFFEHIAIFDEIDVEFGRFGSSEKLMITYVVGMKVTDALALTDVRLRMRG